MPWTSPPGTRVDHVADVGDPVGPEGELAPSPVSFALEQVASSRARGMAIERGEEWAIRMENSRWAAGGRAPERFSIAASLEANLGAAAARARVRAHIA
jgi:hypothetical protein